MSRSDSVLPVDEASKDSYAQMQYEMNAAFLAKVGKAIDKKTSKLIKTSLEGKGSSFPVLVISGFDHLDTGVSASANIAHSREQPNQAVLYVTAQNAVQGTYDVQPLTQRSLNMTPDVAAQYILNSMNLKLK